jgi:hypothetical protein
MMAFQVRVELAMVNVVGRYARVEHDACIAMVLNDGRVIRVAEQVGVPYKPRLVPSSEASKEAMKKRKSDAGVRLARKRVKVSDQKAMPPKVPTASESMGAASSKGVMAKTAHAKSVLRAHVVPRAGVPPKVSVSSGTAISKPVVVVTAQKARVLRINTGGIRVWI